MWQQVDWLVGYGYTDKRGRAISPYGASAASAAAEEATSPSASEPHEEEVNVAGERLELDADLHASR